ncbi:MAG TPA: hypothetical protein VFA21_16930 [Pyrinomonadaceae bacterium]|nr:hypothetical protein [Pyrinomonadaceae bacterium]
MGFYELASRAKQHPQVILDAGLIAPVPGLLQIKTCRRKLYKRAVYVILTLFRRAEVLQHVGKAVMKLPFLRWIRNGIEQRGSFGVNPKSVVISVGGLLDDG